MDINQFSIYSMISKVSDNESTEKILKTIEDFEQITTINLAKWYLKKFYNIYEPICNFPVNDNGYMSIEENDNVFKVTFSYENNNTVFCYRK